MDASELFGEVISSYTRAQAIEDGTLVDVSTVAKEAGWTVPVAVTRTVWIGCVEVPPGVIGQDEQGRLWDVVYMAMIGVKAHRGEHRDRVTFGLHVRKDNRERTPPLVQLVAVVGPGDHGEPVVTIMEPDED